MQPTSGKYALTSITHPNGTVVYENSAARSEETLPLVFVHGMWGDAEIFHYWTSYCTDHDIKVYSIELRNHGKTKNLAALGKQSIKWTYVPDVDQIITDIIGKCILVGWSMGGLIGQLVAARNKNVQKLVTVTSGAPRFIPVGFKVAITMPFYMGALLLGKAFKLSARDAVHLMANVGFDTIDRRSFVRGLHHESGTAAYEIAFWKIKSERITCPVLMIAAEQDNITPVHMQKGIKKKLEKAGTEVDYIEIEGASHAIMLQSNVRKTALKNILTWAYGKNYFKPSPRTTAAPLAA